jgi:hypothetical protein
MRRNRATPLRDPPSPWTQLDAYVRGVPAARPAIATVATSSILLEDLPPAFRLACACCAWPPSADRDRRVAAAAQGVDWQRFLKVVIRQRIFGLANAALRDAGVSPPPQVAQRLSELARSYSAGSLALAAETLRLQALLDAEGLPAIFVKGAALAQMAYGDVTLKHGRDIDLLTLPDTAERAFQLLVREGYAPLLPRRELSERERRLVFRHHKDLELVHSERRLHLELHSRLIDNPVLLAGFGQMSSAQEVDVLGGRVRTLADAQTFSYLCIHGATHGWFRLKWLADLNAWLAQKPQADLVTYYRFAQHHQVGPCAAQSLTLCRDLLGLELPHALAPELEGRRTRRMVAGAMDAMAGADGEVELYSRPFGLFRLLPQQFLRSRGAAFYLAQCRLLIESLDDRLDVPLPRALHFLYPALRLPLWLRRVARRRRAQSSPGPA